jgi:outer membrane PBP1 activator LpoA protein
MRKLLPVLILSLILIGCSKKEEERPLDKMLGEKQKKSQSESYEVGSTDPDPAGHYQKGFDAYRDIKDIRKEEQDRQAEQKETIDEVDNQ